MENNRLLWIGIFILLFLHGVHFWIQNTKEVEAQTVCTPRILLGWYNPCPAGWTDTGLRDCDSGDEHDVREDSCDHPPIDNLRLCIGLAVP